MLNMIKEIGNKKLETKSIIWASSLGAEIGRGDAAGGLDCCETPDKETTESTCKE